MAKIFSPPASIGEVPGIGLSWEEYQKAEDAYIKKVQEYAKANGSGPNKGKILSLPYADGSALYVVLKPTQLIHLPVGDAWHYPYIEHMTAKEIANRVETSERLSIAFRTASADSAS